MFHQMYDLNQAKLRDAAETELEETAADYASGVLDEEYRFNDFLESKGMEVNQSEKMELAEAYRDVVQKARSNPPVKEAEDYLPSIVTNLELEDEISDDVLENAFTFVRDITENNVQFESDYKPTTKAAGAVYLGGLRRDMAQNKAANQQEVADAAEISSGSVKNFSNEIDEIMLENKWNFPDMPATHISNQ